MKRTLKKLLDNFFNLETLAMDVPFITSVVLVATRRLYLRTLVKETCVTHLYYLYNCVSIKHLAIN